MEHKTSSFDWDKIFYSAETGLFHYDYGYRIGQKVRVKVRNSCREPYRIEIWKISWISIVSLFDPLGFPEIAPRPSIEAHRFVEHDYDDDNKFDDEDFDPVSKRGVWYNTSDPYYDDKILLD